MLISTNTKTAYKFRPYCDVAIIKKTVDVSKINECLISLGKADADGCILIDNTLLSDCYVEFHSKEGAGIYHSIIDGQVGVAGTYFEVTTEPVQTPYWEIDIQGDSLKQLGQMNLAEVNLGSIQTLYTNFQRQTLIAQQIADAIKNYGYEAITIQSDFTIGQITITVKETGIEMVLALVAIAGILTGLAIMGIISICIKALNESKAKVVQAQAYQQFEQTKQTVVDQIQKMIQNGQIDPKTGADLITEVTTATPPAPAPTPEPTPSPDGGDIFSLFGGVKGFITIIIAMVFLIVIVAFVGGIRRLT
jgi:hypothetical protein